MEEVMQRFHGTAARQLVLIGDRPETAAMFAPRPAPARLRLMRKDLYAELTRRRRHAQIEARKWVEDRVKI
jgi:hypothetical protein